MLEVRAAPATQAEPHPVLEVDFAGDDAAKSSLLRDLMTGGLPVLNFSETMHDVEDVFMQVTKGIVS